MSQFKVRFGLLEGVLLALLAVYLVRLRPVPLAVFTTGFAASALEVVLLLGFQILYGSVYHQVGLIVTMFMLGLGIGSLVVGRGAARPRPPRPGLAAGGAGRLRRLSAAGLVGTGAAWRQLAPAAAASGRPAADAGAGRPGGHGVSAGGEAGFPQRGRHRRATLHGRLHRAPPWGPCWSARCSSRCWG